MSFCARFSSSGAFPQLETLSLSSNKIGDPGLSAFATVLTPGPSGKGALAQMTILNLGENQIGVSGVKALADAVSSGALASLKKIYVDNASHSQLVAACQPRGIEII